MHRKKSNSTIKEHISRIDECSLKGWSEKPISVKKYRDRSTGKAVINREEDPIENSLQHRIEYGGNVESVVNNLF